LVTSTTGIQTTTYEKQKLEKLFLSSLAGIKLMKTLILVITCNSLYFLSKCTHIYNIVVVQWNLPNQNLLGTTFYQNLLGTTFYQNLLGTTFYQTSLGPPFTKTSLGPPFMFRIGDRCSVYTGKINKDFLYWDFILSSVIQDSGIYRGFV
jgi:hypothetical protein